VLRKAPTAACNRLGFKVGNDGDLDKAARSFPRTAQLRICRAAVPGPHAAIHRSLRLPDRVVCIDGKRPHLLRRYDLYKGCHPQRLDHFNVFAAEVQDTVDFYARLGFRLTEYGEEDGPNWAHCGGLDAPQGQCA
jgi:hypothetical protein